MTVHVVIDHDSALEFRALLKAPFHFLEAEIRAGARTIARKSGPGVVAFVPRAVALRAQQVVEPTTDGGIEIVSGHG